MLIHNSLLQNRTYFVKEKQARTEIFFRIGMIFVMSANKLCIFYLSLKVFNWFLNPLTSLD